MPHIHLYEYAGLDRNERFWFGRQLSESARDCSRLATELPLVAAGYDGKLRAFWRLGRVERGAAKHHLWPAVIMRDSHAIGVVTVQKAVPRPNPIPTSAEALGELAYWHRDVSEDEALAIGGKVISLALSSNLRTKQKEQAAISSVWSVTNLWAENNFKQAVLEVAGFTALEAPQAYDIGDGVGADRQLWLRPVAGVNPST